MFLVPVYRIRQKSVFNFRLLIYLHIIPVIDFIFNICVMQIGACLFLYILHPWDLDLFNCLVLGCEQ